MIFDKDQTTQSTNLLQNIQNNDVNLTKLAEDVKKREAYKLALMAIQIKSQKVLISSPTIIQETIVVASGNNINNNAVEAEIGITTSDQTIPKEDDDPDDVTICIACLELDETY